MLLSDSQQQQNINVQDKEFLLALREFNITSREARRQLPGWSPSIRVKMVMRAKMVMVTSLY